MHTRPLECSGGGSGGSNAAAANMWDPIYALQYMRSNILDPTGEPQETESENSLHGRIGK
jgi:hypothetical protein